MPSAAAARYFRAGRAVAEQAGCQADDQGKGRGNKKWSNRNHNMLEGINGLLMEYISHRITESQIADLVDADAQFAAGPGVGELVGDHAGKGYVRQYMSYHS